MHDPKFDPGFAVAYHHDPTPGRHTIASYQFLDLQHLEKKFKRAVRIPALTTHKEKYRYDNKGQAIVVDCFFKMLLDGSGVCLFGTQIGGDMPLGEWLNAVTGWDWSNDDYLVSGERIMQLRQAFNVREGLTSNSAFRPHPRLYGHPPQSKGPAKGVTLNMDQLGHSFYKAMYWDPDTGKPDKDYLKRLGLEEVARTLYGA
jgi:aldehyde:ferredoxin oxidoreductase